MDLSILINEYLADTKYAPVLINHFNTLTKLIYAKNPSGNYVVQKEFRHIITNMFNKFIHTGYVQYVEDDDLIVAQPLVQRLTMLERLQFEEALIGGVVSISYNGEEFDSRAKEINPEAKEIDELRFENVRDLIKEITGYYFSDEYESKLDIPLKIVLHHFED
jgi:hypothetical protein